MAQKTNGTKDNNPMRAIKLSKLTLNIGLKESGEKVEKAVKLLNIISNKKPTKTYATRRARTFKIRKGLPIGAKVTLRGKDAEELLKHLIKAKDNKLSKNNFDSEGNFGFGLQEYLEIPGIKYDPYIGMMGLNITVNLERSGYRVKKRRLKKTKIAKNHRISKQEAIEYVSSNFGITVE